MQLLKRSTCKIQVEKTAKFKAKKLKIIINGLIYYVSVLNGLLIIYTRR